MPQNTRRLSDLEVANPGFDPNPALGAGVAGLPMNEWPGAGFLFPTITTQFVDTNSVMVPGRIKTLLVEVTTAILQTAGQATIQVYTSRQQIVAAAGGGASQLPHAGNNGDATVVGGTANFGPSAANIPVGLYAFSPSQLPELQWWYPFIGLEFKFNVSASAGALSAWLEVSPL